MSLLYTNSVYKVWIFQKKLRICGFSAWGARFLRHETARPVAKTVENLYNINQTCMEQYRKGGGNMDYYKAALELHEQHKGKIEVTAKVPVKTRDDLSAAYTPGVAEPCREIAKDPAAAYTYTAKGNLVAVVTNGTAVLGLGDIGAAAAMPVMEGKAILFKEFGGVDAFPICLDTKDPEQVIKAVRLLAPTFGGVNLEDISSPNCFYIEETLEKELDIPVFHDDQHGTAIIALAGLTNALRVVGKRKEDVKVVFSGAGSAAISITKLLLQAGFRDITLCDKFGALYEGNPNMNWAQQEIARRTNLEKKQGTLADLLVGADVFIGVSAPNLVTPEMVSTMNRDAIVFACANPTPEIFPDDARAGGARVVATGRSDYPNQINNVLAFPGIFRGALDVRASDINEEMKMAAAMALAAVIPEEELSEENIIPKPFDPRVVPAVAAAVAEAREVLDTGLVDMMMFSINPSYDYQHGEYANGSATERMALYRRCEAAGVGISVRPSETLGTRLMYAAVRTQGGDYIRVAMQYNGFLRDLVSLLPALLGAGLVAFAVAAFVATRVAKTVTDPISDFTESLKNVQEGGARLEPEKYPYEELQAMAGDINRMSEEIARNMRRLEREKAKIDYILDNMNEGFVLLDTRRC